jgi:glucose/arabinose dehydrogenase
MSLDCSLPAVWRATCLGALGAALCGLPAGAAPVVPPGFATEEVTSGLSLPVALAVASDGRVFVTEKASGQVRVIRGDTLLARPLVDLDVNSCGERGALGIALDPAFEANRHLFVFYTLSSTGDDVAIRDSVVDHRVVRFTVSGDTAVAGSETLIRSLPVGLCAHNGGNLHFGADGMLYLTLGDENLDPQQALDLGDLRGKMLRLDPATGAAAADNYFATDGDPSTRGEIWAYGLRNSFDFTFHPTTGAVLATENGQDTDDEVNRLVERRNYGWPVVEGPADTPDELAYVAGEPFYRDPVWTSGATTFCPTGIVAFPSITKWGAALGATLLVGYCSPVDGSRRIVRFPLVGAAEDSVGGPPEVFATGFGLLTDLEVDAEERLYVCTWSGLWRITPPEPVAVERDAARGGPAVQVLGAASSGAQRVRFWLGAPGPAVLGVHDVRGRLVRRWEWAWLAAGAHELAWGGEGRAGERMPPGVYFWRLRGPGGAVSTSSARLR